MCNDSFDTVWSFVTARFRITFAIREEPGYQYDGDDEDGETQSKLNSGEYVAFESRAAVYFDGEMIGADYLGGSVYSADTVSGFWTAHRDPNPMNRNCSLMRAAQGDNAVIGHYFPDMIAQAVKAARHHLAVAPRLRQIA